MTSLQVKNKIMQSDRELVTYLNEKLDQISKGKYKVLISSLVDMYDLYRCTDLTSDQKDYEIFAKYSSLTDLLRTVDKIESILESSVLSPS